MRDRVFISYRRSDSQITVEHLMPRLAEHFGSGQVYRDVDSNRAGFDFTKQMEEALDASAVVLVFIGSQWVTAADGAGGRRLDDPDDFTRREIEQALSSHDCVIPVLVDTGEMPTGSELPESLRPLTRRHAVRLRSTDWNHDVGRLIEQLERNGVRPSTAEEDFGAQRKAFRAGKVYEREYSASSAHTYEILSATLRALRYPIITADPERSEVRFLWGSEEKAVGRTVAAFYRHIEPDGVRATVLETRPGHAKIVIESPSIPRLIAGASSLTPLLGIPAGSMTMLQRKVIGDFLDQVQGFLAGNGISKDPIALLDNFMVRWTKRRGNDL